MLKSYLTIAWRNLVKHKSYSLINIIGLTIGLGSCILIALYAREEFSYDRFHEKSDRIVVVGKDGYFGRSLITPYPLAEALEQDLSAIETASRTKGAGNLKLSPGGETFIEVPNGRYADSRFFDIFSFTPLSKGTQNLLGSPNEIVLTKDTGQKLFNGENPVGQTVYWQKEDTLLALQVTGLVATPPSNSSITFGALISMATFPERWRSGSWNSSSFQTYGLLRENVDRSRLEEQFEVITDKYYNNNPPEYFSVPLTGVHLSELSNSSGFTGNKKYLYLFGSVALFILLIACVNYVNLATARVSIRFKEVGIRKSIGASRMQVAGQFLGESLLLTMGAYLLSLFISSWLLPYFNALFGTHLNWEESLSFLAALGGVAVLVGLLAGAYPSFYLSGFSPISILRNRMPSGSSESALRKILVVGQFTIALVLIIGSLVVFEQLQYAQTKDLGFDGEQVVSFTLPGQMMERKETIINRVISHPGIRSVSMAGAIPGSFNIRMGVHPKNLSPEVLTESDNNIEIAPSVVDYNYLETLNIDLLAGRDFSIDRTQDFERGFIINKKLATQLGWSPGQAVGKTLDFKGEGEVIGVTDDFHTGSLRSEIGPVLLQLRPTDSWGQGAKLLARLEPDQIPAAMDFLESTLEEFVTNGALNAEFLDQKFDAMYRTERRLGEITGIFTFVAILIACLGLYGLAAFSAERRIKEIGIRKVMGATIANIVKLLSGDFLKLVIAGFLIAAPIGWYLMNQWLTEFAYRIDIGPGIFLLAGASALFVAIATVSWQALRTALANPIDSLRSE